MAIMFGTAPAWAAETAQGAGSAYEIWNETLQGAEGSQLGLFYIDNIGNVKDENGIPNHPFMDLKFSSSSLTVYYIGSIEYYPPSIVNGEPENEDQATEADVDLEFSSCTNSDGYTGPGQWVYTPSLSGSEVKSETIPFSQGSKISFQYPSYSLLHSYVASSSAFSYNADTFNSGTTHNAVAVDNGEQTTNTESTSNTNYFVANNGNIQETGKQDESVKFKNGAEIDFNPYSDIFSIQKGSSSSTASVKITSSGNGGAAQSLSLNEDSSGNSFASGDEVTISTSSSNPITSAQYAFTGETVSASTLASQGWNLEGTDTVTNRYNSVQLRWQPSASDLQDYRYMLFKYLGLANFDTLRSVYPAFFNWLINDPEALNEFLTSGYASDETIEQMTPYLWGFSTTTNKLQESPNPNSELSSLEIWAKIWRKYPNSRSGTDLKIAVAVSLDFAHNVMTWGAGAPINPVGRYEVYAAALSDNTLIGSFSQYSAQMMRDVVDDEISNADLEWFRNYILHSYSIYTYPPFVNEGYTLIHYTFYSPYGWVMAHGFSGPSDRLDDIWSMLRYAGVCGTNSKFSSFLLRAFGEAGWVVGQAKIHAAFTYFYRNKWNLGYYIVGWKQTAYDDTVIPLMFNATQLNANQFTKDESYSLTFEAEEDMASGNYEKALSCIKQAESLAPNNIDCWEAYIEICNHLNQTSGLKDKIETTFDDLSSTAPYIQPGTQAPYSGSLNYDNIITDLQAEVQ